MSWVCTCFADGCVRGWVQGCCQDWRVVLVGLVSRGCIKDAEQVVDGRHALCRGLLLRHVMTTVGAGSMELRLQDVLL